MLNHLFLTTLSHLSNACLSFDIRAGERIQHVSGKIIHFKLRNPFFEFQIRAGHNKIFFEKKENIAADAVIYAKTSSLLFQTLSRMQNSSSLQPGIEISGDPSIVQAFAEIFERYHIEWEEHLSQIFGDVLARPIILSIKTLTNIAENIKNKSLLNSIEYIQEEKRWLPTKFEVEDFCHDVYVLRNDIERLEQRIKRVEKLMSA